MEKYLPFLNTLTFLTEEEKELFHKALQKEAINGVRINKLKISREEFKNKFIKVEDNPHIDYAFYYHKQDYSFGRHPFFLQGIIYLQEPSATEIVEAMDIQESDLVMDLTAAPGGKSSQIIANFPCRLLWANDVNYQRALVLEENLSKLGKKEIIITSSSIKELAQYLPNTFDKVLLDAPCSLEGTFRKDEEAFKDWSIGKVERLARLQKELIADAFQLVKEGGILFYSTCTFSQEENEEVVQHLLSLGNNQLVNIKKKPGFTSGVGMEETVRIYPFRFKGEGHFLAAIKKTSADKILDKRYKYTNLKEQEYHLVKDFFAKSLKIPLPQLHKIGDQVFYMINQSLPILKNTLAFGVKIGYFRQNNFFPAHQLAMMLDSKEAMNSYELNNLEVLEYIKGNVISAAGEGYVLLTFSNQPIGWGKASNGKIKNLFPKYLRMNNPSI